MTGVVRWTCACALLAIAAARIYDRCELARELYYLGIEKENIPTWVCIAFHESRFDTVAYNHGSGDHGLLQISEQYWCGPSKACNTSCSAFRDDDIKDDVECALLIHEEHTRLQGDGFMAWVVYPLYCKHKTKKYLADCDSLSKNVTTKLADKSRNQNSSKTFSGPSYLRIHSFLQESIHTSNSLERGGKLLPNKIINIDELTLPPIDKQGFVSTVKVSTSMTTEMTPLISKTERITTINTPSITPLNLTTTLIPNRFDHTSVTIKKTFSREPTTSVRLKSTITTQKPLFTLTTLGTTKKSTSATLAPGSTTTKPTIINTPNIMPLSLTTTLIPNRFDHTSVTIKKTFSREPTTSVRLKSTITTRKPLFTLTTLRTAKKSTSATLAPGSTSTKPKTQSLFDLYLNPTTNKIPLRRPLSRDNRYVLKIFSDGTTASPYKKISQS